MTDKIYLDYNATAPILPAARDKVAQAMNSPYNASAVHSFGREGRRLVEEARAHIAALLNIPSEQIIFNSGATEGNNTIIRHFRAHYPQEAIITSAIEHPAILECDTDLLHIPVTAQGVIDLNALETLLQDNKTALVSVMMVNNETGAIQPVKEAADLAHKHGALFHSDATQAIGRIPVDMQELGIDFLTLSSHKIAGPQGVGALALRLCGETPTLLLGGGQEKSARAGTENVAGIAGFGEAARHAADNLEHYKELRTLQTKLEAGLKALSPDAIIHSAETDRVPNTTFFSLPGTSSETLMMALDLEGIAVSNGSACSSGTVKPSAVLKSMGHDDETASSALRLSTGWNTAESEIDAALKAWENIYTRIKT